MPKYEKTNSANLVIRCAPQSRTDFLSLAIKENEPDQNLCNADFGHIPPNAPVINGDELAKACSPRQRTCSMDFAFVLNDGKALLGEMKFNVDGSVRQQLKSILKKFKGTYSNLHALITSFHNRSFVLFNEDRLEEGISVLSRLDEEFQEDALVKALDLHFVAKTLPSFSIEFF